MANTNNDLTNATTTVVNALKDVGDAVAPYAQHAWEIMVKQQFIEGMVNSIMMGTGVLVALIMSAVCFRFAHKMTKEAHGNPGEEVFIPVMGTILFLVIAVILFCSTPEYIMQVCNPEYYAIQMVLESIK